MKRFFAMALTVMCCGIAFCQQQDLDGDGVCDPDATHPAFGTVVNYKMYPQITNLPTMYITSEGSVDFQTKTETYYTANVVIVDHHGKMKQRNESVTFRGRGNATWTSTDKKPWRLKFPSKVDLLVEQNASFQEVNNFATAKSWTLLANNFDKSMINNALTYEWGKMLGMPFCPSYRFVDLVLNGEYFGTYQISDHMEVREKRVEVNANTGWFLELCSYEYVEPGDISFSSGGYNVVVKNPEVVSVAPIQAYMDNVCSEVAKSSNNYSNSPQNISQYVDVESLARFLIGMDMTANWDAVKGNGYCFREDDGMDLLKFGPIWDMDLSYGNIGGWTGSVSDADKKHFWEVNSGYTGSFWSNSYKSAEIQEVLYPIWKKVYADGKLTSRLQAKITRMYNTILASAIKNYTEAGHGWSQWTMGDNQMGISYTTSRSVSDVETNFAKAIKDRKDFIASHVEWLNAQYKTDYEKATGLSAEAVVVVDDYDDAVDVNSDATIDGSGYDVSDGNAEEDNEDTSGGTSNVQSLTISKYSDPVWESWGAHLYSVSGDAATMVSGANISITATSSNVDIYYGINRNSSMWKDNKVDFTLTDDEVANLASNNYTMLVVVWSGECSKATITTSGTGNSGGTEGGAICTSHEYIKGNYAQQADGTYLRTCDNCSTPEEGGSKYYKFKVYPESNNPVDVYAASWTPSSTHPNSIAVVDLEQNVVEQIDGYNIVCGKKNADGNLTCKDFRLADSNPYYSPNKFIATSATYTRLLDADENFGMMTLPFKHQNAENEDAEFYHIEKVEGDKIRLTAIDPSIEGNASAYLPVIFKRKAGKNSVTVTGTDITVKKSTTAVMTNSTCEGWTIKGAVESTSVTAADGNNLYEMSDSKLGNVSKTSSLTIAPFRACLSTTATAPDILTFLCPRAAEVSVSSLVDAIKQLANDDMTVEEIDNIVEELLNQ